MEAPLAPEQQYWVIQPLLDAGLELEEIATLVFDLGFQAIVTEGHGTANVVQHLVNDRPTPVRAAWAQTIGRMLALDAPASDPPWGRTG